MKISNQFKHKTDIFINNAKGCDKYTIIILVETYFRPFTLRLFEYILYGVLRVVCPRKASKMTLGLNQLRASDWVNYLSNEGESVGFLETVFACESLCKAKETTKIYLESKKFNFSGEEKLSFVFTGRNNYYYDSLYSFAYSKLLHRKQTKIWQ
jgi:hypothetical protein